MVRSVRVRIHGRVQGVGYRAYIVEEAERLGPDGWVRNRRDGTVEAVFSADGETIDQMIATCRQGPRSAIVERIDVEDEAQRPASGFRVLSTS